jgi:hypothetical protein
MNKLQTKAHLAALALIAAKAKAQPEFDALGTCAADATEAEFEAHCDAEDEIYARHDLDRLSTAKVEAERAVVLWSIDEAAKTARTASERAAVKLMREGYNKTPDIWERMLDLAMRLDAADPVCACYRGSTCDINHDPAACSCTQCEAER